MTIFEKVAASPETLGAFLSSLSIANSPWEKEFHKRFCADCGREDCDAGPCPHQGERANPTWWLGLESEELNRIVLWVKRDGYKKAMEELVGKLREARSERVKETGDESFTYLEAVLTELIEVLSPDMKCRVVMDYDPDAEKIILYQLPAHDAPAGT